MNQETDSALYKKSKLLALETIRLVNGLRGSTAVHVLGKQLLRSGTSVYANYRASCKARSKAEFIAKLGIVEEESDETKCWLELMSESGIEDNERTAELRDLAGQVLAMATASIKTARKAKENASQ